MVDKTNNYNWEIPQKYKIDWYNDFFQLIQKIDSQLKEEEQQRILNDQTILSLIPSTVLTKYLVWIPIRNSTSGKTSYTGTTWAERINVSAYTKEYFGLPANNIKKVTWFISYRARMVNINEQGYAKARLRQTIPTGQYIETPERTISTTSWLVFHEVYEEVPINIFTPNGVIDCMIMLKVDNGTIEAYMDRAFLIFTMEGS